MSNEQHAQGTAEDVSSASLTETSLNGEFETDAVLASTASDASRDTASAKNSATNGRMKTVDELKSQWREATSRIKKIPAEWGGNCLEMTHQDLERMLNEHSMKTENNSWRNAEEAEEQLSFLNIAIAATLRQLAKTETSMQNFGA